MGVDVKVLNKEINTLKETLYILLGENKLTDKSVVECSQRLDKLIVEYQNIKVLLEQEGSYQYSHSPLFS